MVLSLRAPLQAWPACVVNLGAMIGEKVRMRHAGWVGIYDDIQGVPGKSLKEIELKGSS